MPLNLDEIHFEPVNERDRVINIFKQAEKLIKSAFKTTTGHAINKEFDIEKALVALENDPKYSEVMKIPYRDLISFKVRDFQIKDITILTSINKDKFQNTLLNLFDEIALDKKFIKRKDFIKEAFKLYEQEFFAGCVCLLYTQIEGIITDYLIFKKITKAISSKGKIIFPRNPINPTKKDNISGLKEKIALGNGNESIRNLEKYKFSNNLDYKFGDERNNVLHGSCINGFTAEKCLISFHWVHSILQSIKIELSK